MDTLDTNNLEDSFMTALLFDSREPLYVGVSIDECVKQREEREICMPPLFMQKSAMSTLVTASEQRSASLKKSRKR